MANISVSTVNKFLREVFDENDTGIEIATREKQVEFLEDYFKQLESIDYFYSRGLASRWVDGDYKKFPELEIEVLALVAQDSWKDDKAPFIIGFRDEGDELKIWSDSYRTRSKAPRTIMPLSDLKDIDKLVKKVNERFKLNRIKSQKKNTTEGFTVNNIRARIDKIAQKKQFNYAVGNRGKMFLVYISKDGLGPLRIKFMKDDSFQDELEKLTEYIDHALFHLPFSERISIPKEPSYKYSQLKWVNYSS